MQSVEAEYKLNERTIQKKTLFGAETKGKGEALLPLFQEDSSLQ